MSVQISVSMELSFVLKGLQPSVGHLRPTFAQFWAQDDSKVRVHV